MKAKQQTAVMVLSLAAAAAGYLIWVRQPSSKAPGRGITGGMKTAPTVDKLQAWTSSNVNDWLTSVTAQQSEFSTALSFSAGNASAAKFNVPSL